jgi:hypothetical protein
LGRKEFQTERRGQILSYRCDCVAQWKAYHWLLNAGVGKTYQQIGWDDIADGVDSAVRSKVADWLTQNLEYKVNYGMGLTLWSKDKGTGKTALSALVLKSLLASNYSGYFLQLNVLVDEYQATWRDEEARAWFNRRIRDVEVLVVDDMGREGHGRANVIIAMLDSVIRSRVANQKTTIMTTNYTPEEMRQGYGDNLASLLQECNTLIAVNGEDWRLKAAERTARFVTQGLARPVVFA